MSRIERNMSTVCSFNTYKDKKMSSFSDISREGISSFAVDDLENMIIEIEKVHNATSYLNAPKIYRQVFVYIKFRL
jgi:hypothetical protein